MTETILLDEEAALEQLLHNLPAARLSYLEPDSLTEIILLDEDAALEQLLHNLTAAR